MKETLVLLYALQKVDSLLQELEEEKGDLPQVVNSLQNDITALIQQKEDLRNQIDSLKISRERSDTDILSFKEKIDKYREQQFQVRNNREYDALTKEIDFSTDQISTLEREFLEAEGKLEVFVHDLAALENKIKEDESLLNEKNTELEILSKETEAEELKYKHQREKLIVRLDQEIVERYERIKIARRGKAVSPIRKNACGGCNNRIPPQHVFEINLSQNLYICGHCGRVIVSQEVSDDANRLENLS
ncbi:MAG: hypothetical protein O3A55_04140 [Bacteroidetes bacterium]|nr:hypothetical protein [Bacteroidota bacterium]